MRRQVSVAWVLCGALAVSAAAVLAQGPKLQGVSTPLGSGFSYQGQLKKGNTLVNDPTCSLTFSLWDAPGSGSPPTGGTQLGSDQTLTPVAVSNGLFTVVLNSANQFGPSAFSGQARWLQVDVQCTGDGAPVTLSRQPLSAAPYALFAAAPWVTSGSNIAYNNGSVGIGTTSPSQALHIDEPNARLRLHSILSDTWTVTEYATDNRVWHTGVGGSNVPNDLKDKYYIWDDTAGAARLVISTTGNVGIGTTNPNPVAKLDVETTSGTGVYGNSTNGWGLSGASTNGWGVLGQSTNGFGVEGDSTAGTGVFGSSSSGIGVFGASNTGYAGHFNGNVQVSGNLTVTGNLVKGGGSFKIDHPLDPANEYLSHSFVESPDMKNIYDGVVTTDANGDATVVLPDWFEALNQDFRYQLTPIGQFAQAMVASEIQDNRFTIKTDKANVKVSWQVTGIRHDPYANAHRIPVEEEKSPQDQGKYLYPTEYGQPESLGIDYALRQRMPQPAVGP